MFKLANCLASIMEAERYELSYSGEFFESILQFSTIFLLDQGCFSVY